MARLVCLLVCLLAIVARGDTATEIFLRGLDQLEAGDFKAASDSFREAIDADDENADYRIALGVALTLAEQLPEAEKALSRAIKLSNNAVEARLWLATAIAMQGDFTRGTDVYPFAIARNEYVNEIRRMSHNYGQGAAAMETARRNGNNEADVTYAKQELAKRDGLRKQFPKYGAAFSQRMKTKLGVRPSGGQSSAPQPLGAALLDRIKANILKEDYAGAMRDINPLLLANGNDPQLITYHGLAQLNLGAPEIARRQFTRVLYVYPLDGELYALRAVAAARTGDARRATLDLETARSLQAKRLAWAESEVRAAPQPDGEPVKMLEAMLESAKNGATYPQLVDAAVALTQAQNARRLRLDEDYVDQLRGHQQAVNADKTNPDKLAAFAAFLYDNASSPRGEAVELRATWQPYRPADEAMLEREITRALNIANEALAIDANNLSALITKAAVLVKRMQLADAEQFLKSALQRAPTEPRLLRLFAEVADRAAAAKQAQAYALRAPTTWEDTMYIYTRYPSAAERAQADALEAQAERLWAMARDALSGAIANASDEAEKAFLQAVVERRAGRRDTALAFARRAVELKPASLEYLDMLTALLAATGQRAEALLNQARATNLVHSTGGAALKCVWLSLPRTKFKTSREYLAQAAQYDAADWRVAAYYGAVAGADERTDLAASWYAVAAALQEAQARLQGVSSSSREPSPLRTDVAVSRIMINLRAASLLRGTRPDDAIALLQANLSLEPRMIEAELFTPVPAAMLPDVNADQIPVPQADHAGFLLSVSRLELGRALLAQKQFDTALAEFERVAMYRDKVPPTVDGNATKMQPPISAAAVWAVSTLLAKGDRQAAIDRFRFAPRPNNAMDAETRAEYARIAAAVGQMREDERSRQDAEVEQQIRDQQDAALKERQRQIKEFERRRRQQGRPG